MLFIFAACEKEMEPVSVEFKSQTYEMTVGQTIDLAGEVKVTNSNKKPSFSSSAEKIVSVNKNGVLSAVAQGQATITAEVEGVSATCVVTVSDIKAEKIVLNVPASHPADNSWANLTAEVSPSGYNTSNLVWSFTPSSEELKYETEKVNSSTYKVRFSTFVEGAKLEVKVADKNSTVQQTATVAVTEKVVQATKISLTMPEELTEGEVWATVTATVAPEDYDTGHLVWEFVPSSEELGFKSEKISPVEYKVCFTSYVEDGSVLVKVSDELSEVFNQGRIKVLEKPIEGVTKLTLSPSTLSLTIEDEPFALQVSYEPASYDASLLEWSTSAPEVVTVDKGTVTVVGEGEAVVKVKDTISGKEASCAVTVIVPVKEAVVSRIDISQTNLTLRVGEETVQLTAACYDEDGNLVENYSELEWSADVMTSEDGKNINVVEVSQQGVVTPKNAGSTIVYVTNKKNTNVKAKCHVTVEPAEIKVDEIRLEPSSKVIEIGQKFTLTTIISPSNAENKTLTFTSSDPAVASVTENGEVSALAVGEAVITATSANGVKGTCNVTVADESWVYLSDSEITLVVGDEKTLTATVTPEDAPDKTVTWTSSDPEVVSVDSGKLTALKEGTAVITATAANGKSAQCKVTVEAEAVEFEITLTPSDQSITTKGLMQDKTVHLYAQYIRKKDGKNHTPANLSWTSSDETIATVDSEGNVTAVIEHVDKSGYENGKKVVITHTADDKEKSYEITVVKAMPVAVEIIEPLPEVNGEKLKIYHGDTFTFSAKVYPDKANQAAKWMCGANGKIGFEDGVFSADNVGIADIIAYAYDDINIRTTVWVEILPVDITSFTINAESLEMTVGAEATLSVDIQPSNASYKELTWSSSDESVATVDQHGTVSAHAAGTAVITAVQPNNDLSVSCEVTVTEPDSAVKVGDYYYSDGTTSSDLDPSKTVVGVVFSLSNPTQMGDDGLAGDYPGCTHGYVLSTVEYADQDFGSVSTYNGHGYYAGLGYDANLIVSTDKANGYTNTMAHRDLNASRSDYCKLFNSADGVVANLTASAPTPEGASCWYVPSYKEMTMIVENLETVNASLTAAGGTAVADPYPYDDSWDSNRTSDWYWTSTIYGEWYESGKTYDHHKYPFDLSNNGWTRNVQSSAKCKVRVILAF